MHRISLVLLTLLLFWPFGLDPVDKFGLIPLPLFSATKVFRVFWATTIGVSLLLFVYQAYLKRNNGDIALRIPLLGAVWVLFYEYFLVSSFLFSGYSGLLGLYRLLEISLILVALLALFSLEDEQGPDLATRVQSAFLINFYLIVATLALWLLIEPSMVYQLETQGRTRLGGAVYSPNELSIICAVAMWSAFFLLHKRVVSRGFLVLTCGLSASIGVLTNSRTGVALIAGSLFVMLFKQSRWVRIATVAVIPLVVTVGVANLSLQDVGYGENPLSELKTLNNRIPTFKTAVEGIRQNPWLGIGYVEGTKGFLRGHFDQDFWLPPHSHNGFLEIAFSLGIPFFLLFSAVAGVVLVIALKDLLYSSAGPKVALAMQPIVIVAGSMTTCAIGNSVGPLFTLYLYFIFATLCRIPDPSRATRLTLPRLSSSNGVPPVGGSA